MKKHIEIILASFFVCFAIFLAEQMLHINYLGKLSIKPALFLLIPLAYYGFKIQKEQFRLKNIKKAVILGGIFFATLIVSYIVLSEFIDLSIISKDLEQRYNISKSIFIFVGLYIIFINSFLEEFFFRGFIFLNIAKENKLFAHIYSALLFSIYHTSIFLSWFSDQILLVSLIGLFAVGIFFNILDEKEKSIIPSWISHIFADIAIIIIGLIMFGII